MANHADMVARRTRHVPRRVGTLNRMGEVRKFGRRALLGGAVATGAAVAGLNARAGASGAPYSAVLPNGRAPSGAAGLGPGGCLLPPGSLPYPHLPPGTDTLPAIEHVVILMMENHSFDDHFGMLGRGDGLSFGRNGSPLNYNPGTGR